MLLPFLFENDSMKLLRQHFIVICILCFFTISARSQTTEVPSQTTNSQFIKIITSFIQNVSTGISSFFVGKAPSPPNSVETQQGLQDTLLFQALSSIKEQIPPFIYDKYAVFTYFDTNENSSVSIASSTNNYKEPLPFFRLQSNKKVLVQLIQRKAYDTTLQYRMVINGVWSYDTSNPNTIIDPNGIPLSTITIPSLDSQYIPSFIPLGNNRVRFVLSSATSAINLHSTAMRGAAIDLSKAHAIYLNANFTGWDPFLLKMEQNTIIDGAYIADVTLSPGTHYYYFQIDGKGILDPKNDDIVQLKNGLYVNRIVISDTSS